MVLSGITPRSFRHSPVRMQSRRLAQLHFEKPQDRQV